MGVNGHTVYRKVYFFTISHVRIRVRYILQVTCVASEHTMKLIDKIIITIVLSYTGKVLVAVGIVTCAAHS